MTELLTSREIALLFWLLLGSAWLLFPEKRGKAIRDKVFLIGQQILNPKMLSMFIGIATCIGLGLYVSGFGTEYAYVKTSVWWGLSVGCAMPFHMVKESPGGLGVNQPISILSFGW